jgi:hypothetical protein
MSSELKTILNIVAQKECERKEKDLKKGVDRYKLLLQKLAKDKKMDVLNSVQGTEVYDSNELKEDLEVLKKANLVKEQTKYTHRNEYRQYELTTKGVELVEKLLKET